MKGKGLNFYACHLFLIIWCMLLLFTADAVGQASKTPPGRTGPQDTKNYEAMIDNYRKQMKDKEIEIKRLESEISKKEGIILTYKMHKNSTETDLKKWGIQDIKRLKQLAEKCPEEIKRLEEELRLAKEELAWIKRAKEDAEDMRHIKEKFELEKGNTEKFEANRKKLKKEISNLYWEIERIQTEMKTEEIIVNGVDKTDQLWQELSAMEKNLREEDEGKRFWKTYPEDAIKDEMNRRFSQKTGPIIIHQNLVIKDYDDLVAFIKEAEPQYYRASKLLDLSNDNVRLIEDQIEEKRQQLIWIEKNIKAVKSRSPLVGNVKSRSPLVGMWSPSGNESVVEVRFNAREKKFTGTLIVNKFRCYKDYDVIFEVVLINKKDLNRFSGRKHVYNDDCKKRTNNLWITVNGDELLLQSKGKKETWYRVHDRP